MLECHSRGRRISSSSTTLERTSIYTVNISPSSSGDWEEDVMGSDILENGESVTVRFSVGSTRYWDIQAIFRDGTSISWYNIDLLETYTVTLNRDGSADLE